MPRRIQNVQVRINASSIKGTAEETARRTIQGSTAPLREGLGDRRRCNHRKRPTDTETNACICKILNIQKRFASILEDLGADAAAIDPIKADIDALISEKCDVEFIRCGDCDLPASLTATFSGIAATSPFAELNGQSCTMSGLLDNGDPNAPACSYSCTITMLNGDDVDVLVTFSPVVTVYTLGLSVTSIGGVNSAVLHNPPISQPEFECGSIPGSQSLNWGGLNPNPGGTVSFS